MIITLLLVSASVLVLGFLICVVRGRSRAIGDVRELPAQTRPVDLGAFRNLIDPAEEEYLRANLAAREFRRIQKQRSLAVIAYVWCAARNASVLLRVGEASRRSPDPQVALAAQQLVNTAIRLRLYAALALVKLYPATLLPGARVSPIPVIEAYQQLTSVVSQLTRLQHPARTIRITASL
jgi:hypothetical protein